MKFSLPVNGPLDPAATLARYHVFGEDPANRVGNDAFRRVLRVDGRLWPYEVRWQQGVDDQRLDVHVPETRSSVVEAAVSREVAKIFGLAFDLPGFYRFAKSDPVLAELVGPLYGLRPTLAPTALEMLVGSISAQQVNLAFAFACRARLVKRYGTPARIAGDTVYAFPDASALAHVRLAEFRAMKFSTRKGEYIREVARAVFDGTLDLDRLADAPNVAVIEAITGLRGLGRWTAEWYLARCLGRGDVCPAGDLGVRRAVERYYARDRELSEEQVRRRARPWGSYRNLAVHYLLAGLRLKLPANGAAWTAS